MVEVYYYIPVADTEDVNDCGLKLSKWHEKQVLINGEQKMCISALLNPKDDIKKYKSDKFKCIKLQMEPRFCFVADKSLYEVGLKSNEVMELYTASIKPVEQYIFGSYRLPECLVTTTVMSDNIGILNKGLDSPVLFNNSEELYINNMVEYYKETHEDFNDTLLYFFYSQLATVGKFDRIEAKEKGLAVFIDKESSSSVTIKIPDIAKYI